MSSKKKGWQKLSDYLKFQNRYYLKGKSLKRKEIHLSIRSNIQYWENCWRSRSITFLPRQCVQENVAADVHNTFHFNQASSIHVEESHARKITQWQKEKSIVLGPDMYLDVWGVGSCGGQWCAANSALSSLQDELRTKQQYVNKVFIVCGCTRVSNLESMKEKTDKAKQLMFPCHIKDFRPPTKHRMQLKWGWQRSISSVSPLVLVSLFWCYGTPGSYGSFQRDICRRPWWPPVIEKKCRVIEHMLWTPL